MYNNKRKPKKITTPHKQSRGIVNHVLMHIYSYYLLKCSQIICVLYHVYWS